MKETEFLVKVCKKNVDKESSLIQNVKEEFETEFFLKLNHDFLEKLFESTNEIIENNDYYENRMQRYSELKKYKPIKEIIFTVTRLDDEEVEEL